MNPDEFLSPWVCSHHMLLIKFGKNLIMRVEDVNCEKEGELDTLCLSTDTNPVVTLEKRHLTPCDLK